jgi:hypothetical protein
MQSFLIAHVGSAPLLQNLGKRVLARDHGEWCAAAYSNFRYDIAPFFNPQSGDFP